MLEKKIPIKITLLRDLCPDSIKASQFIDEKRKLLVSYGVKIRKVHSTSPNLPQLIVSGETHSKQGFEQIKDYLNQIQENYKVDLN